ncbi:MAG: hypothetical protein FWC90_02590 [Oscillospiraceae bacterium]|nr:hypothetical protein [Oscillospiraceae bacterium]
MKKLLILLLVLAAIALLVITSCEPEADDSQIQVVPETYPPELATESEMPEPLNIYGAWIYAKSTEADETPLTIPEFELFPPRLDIGGDNRISAVFYQSVIEGIIANTGTYEFTVSDIAAVTESQQWFPDSVTLIYDPESGLLRYTLVYVGFVIHHYFARM